jgi:hypothetical protein
VCWPFRGRRDLADAVEAFVEEGLANREQVVCLADGPADEIRETVSGVASVDDHLARGRIQVVAVADMPASDPMVDPVSELPVLASMAQRSLSAGYSGMRLLIDATARAADAGRRARQACYEHRLDGFCLRHPVTVLCGYDVARLGESAAAELVCVHPLTGAELSPFQIRAARDADAALAGSVDVLCAPQFEQALGRIGLARPGGPTVVDASDLAFIDVRGLLALERHAAGNEGSLVLRSPPSVVARLVELVALRSVRVQEPR